MGLIDELNLPYLIDLVLLGRIENQDLLSHITRVGKAIYQKNEGVQILSEN